MTLPIKALLLFNSNFLSSCLLGFPLHYTALPTLHRAAQLGKRWIASNCIRLHYRELVSKLHYRKLVSKVKLPQKSFIKYSLVLHLNNCKTSVLQKHMTVWLHPLFFPQKTYSLPPFMVMALPFSFLIFISLFAFISFCLCYVSVCVYSFVCWIEEPRLILPSSSPPIIDSWVCIVSYHYVSVFSFVCVWGDLRLTLPSSSPPIMVSWGSSLPPPSSPPPITINRNP